MWDCNPSGVGDTPYVHDLAVYIRSEINHIDKVWISLDCPRQPNIFKHYRANNWESFVEALGSGILPVVSGNAH
jgi:hypothetical protein